MKKIKINWPNSSNSVYETMEEFRFETNLFNHIGRGKILRERSLKIKKLINKINDKK
jgi:hypothetical protein